MMPGALAPDWVEAAGFEAEWAWCSSLSWAAAAIAAVADEEIEGLIEEAKDAYHYD